MTTLIPALTIWFLSTVVIASDDSVIIFPEESSIQCCGSAFSLDSAKPSTSRYDQYVDLVIARGINKLCLNINKKYQETTKVDNTVFAPLNIAGALALLLLGSNGQTFQELSTVLGLTTGLNIEQNSEKVHEHLGRILRKIEILPDSVQKDEQQITFAGAIFVQNDFPIRKLYKETAENLYQFEIFNLDFLRESAKAAQYINAWVSDRTRGRIQEVLSEPPAPSTKLILASAMYFKAKWEVPFFDEQTIRRPFYPHGRRSPPQFEVELMSLGAKLPYLKDYNLGCEILGLPYKGNKTVFYVVVPFESSIQKLKEFEDRITEADLEYLAENTVYQNALVSFPKMTLESTINLKSVLEKLNVKSLFDSESANLGLISPGISNAGQVERFQHEESMKNPLIPPNKNPNDVIIFNRFGKPVNCSSIFNSSNNITTCEDTLIDDKGEHTVTYKRFGDQVGRRVTRDIADEKTDKRTKRSNMNSKVVLDNLRHLINKQATGNNYQNPGLYVDQIIHKIFLQITEEGTEAAATTAAVLVKNFGKISFRVDVPFLFFMRHEETKTIMFWGSVEKPSPYFNIGS